MCNKCNNSSCCGNCYPAVTNTCPPSYCISTYVPCPTVPAFPSNGIYTQLTQISTSNTEFYVMPGTPKTLIAAPGAGKMIVPLQVFNILRFGTTPYADLAPATPQLLMNLGTQNIITDNTILGAIADQTTMYTLPAFNYAGLLDNQALTLTTFSQPVVGDSVLYSYIIYTVITI